MCLYYHLPATENRKCDIKVMGDRIDFSGQFLYLKDKEFYPNRGQSDTALVCNFLGMGYLSQRSYRKTLLFLVSGVTLEAAKLVLDKASELADKANDALQWFDWELVLPGWMNITVNLLALICLIFGAILFFSKKRVLEISFTDKRICIPRNAISDSEYAKLYQTIKTLRQKINN